MKKLVLIISITTLIISCHKNIGYENTALVDVLKFSGKNKNELLKVLSFYNKPSDSLKLKAAVFLIANMKNKYSYNNDNFKSYKEFFDLVKPIWQNKSLNLEERKRRFSFFYDSLKIEQTFKQLEVDNNNIWCINSDYLIKNINQAFYAWETFPWSRSVSFNDFCNYILPYQVFNEPLNFWRDTLMNKFRWIMDSIKNPGSLKEATILINNAFNKKFSYNSRMNKFPDILSFETLDNINMGSCIHLVTMNIYYLRAMGIPAKVDYTPQWGNNDGKHFWCSINDENGNLFAFDALYQPMNISDSSYLKGTFDFIPETYRRKRKTAKIFRKTYKNNVEFLPSAKLIEKELFPIDLINVNSLDVTASYKNSSTNLALKPFSENNEELLLLCVFRNREWKEVAWSIKSSSGAFEFGNIGTGIVYLPIIVKNNNGSKKKMTPFILQEDGNITYLNPDLSILRSVKLDRKFPIDNDLMIALKETEGGFFQGANYKDFHDAKDLFKITSYPKPKTNHYNLKENDFRYIRFINSENRCKVAEMSFWGIKKAHNNDSLHLLTGSLISSRPQNKDSANRITDGNVLTYFTAMDEIGGWVGFDLGENRTNSASKVDFYPPNDGNSIEIGDKYELLYWDTDWVSLGEKIATDEFLIYKECPENALLLLINQSKGSQERIFIYMDNKQVWF